MFIALLDKELMGFLEDKAFSEIRICRFVKYELALNKAIAPKRVPGIYADQMVNIADDFDKTPEGFEGYM